MNDREKTKLLTKIGYLFLERMKCFEISTEIHIPIYQRLLGDNSNDKHYIIDLLGVEWEYFPPTYPATGKVNKQIILRGIEIKVSKSDFKNGFIHNGCTFNYLMIPKGLIDFKEIHKDVGVIEVDFENLCVRKHQIIDDYELIGVDVVRKPRRKDVSNETILCCQTQIGATLTNQAKRWLTEELVERELNG